MKKTQTEQALVHRSQLSTALTRNRSLLLLLLASILFLLLAGAIDYLAEFGHVVRWVFFGCWTIMSVFFLRRFLIAAAVRPNPSHYGADLESAQGSRRYALPTSIDESVREMKAGDVLEKSLAAHLQHEAERVLEQAPPPRPNANVALSFGFWIVSLSALVFCLLGGWRSFQRITLPWASAPYTRLAFVDPDPNVPANHPLVLRARARGKTPGKIQIHSSSTVTGVVKKTGDKTFEISLPGISEPTEIWISGGDGKSGRLELIPYLAAEVSALEIEVRPPEYARRLARTETQPSFEVLRGSSLAYSVQFSEEVESANLAPAGDEDLLDQETTPLPALRPSPRADAAWTAAFPGLVEDVNYFLEWKTLEKNVTRDPEPSRLLVLQDQPPKVRIVSHNAPEVVKLGSEDVSFRIKTFDDVGVANLKLIYRKVGEEHRALILEVDAESPEEFSADTLLELAPLGLEPFDVVAVHAEAWDGNTLDGPGVGRSGIVYIEVPPPPSDGSEPPGGGGGGNVRIVNPLEMEKEILRETVGLTPGAKEKRFNEIRADQEQAREFTTVLLVALKGQSAPEPLLTALSRATGSMKSASSELGEQDRDEAVPPEETALANLIEAAKLFEESQCQACESSGMKITLKPSGNSSKKSSEDDSSASEALESLLAELKKAEAEQRDLNQELGQNAAQESPGSSSAGQRGSQTELGQWQSELGERTGSSADRLKEIKIPEDAAGDRDAAKKDLASAAAYQKRAAGSIDQARYNEAAREGAGGSEKLNDAIEKLEVLLASYSSETDRDHTPPGYVRLVKEYLRSISYE